MTTQASNSIILESNDDFYHLISLAVDFDRSFSDARLLESPLEKTFRIHGRRCRNNHKVGDNTSDNDEFAEAVLFLLQLRETWSLSQALVFYLTRPHRPKGLTPIVLSGLLSLLERQQLSATTAAQPPRSREADTIIIMAQSNGKITVTSSDLVLFCQGLRKAALVRLRVTERRRRFFFFFVLPLVLSFSVMILLSKSSSKIERELMKIGLLNKNSCNLISKQSTQQVCHLTDSAVFDALYEKDPFAPPKMTVDMNPLLCQQYESVYGTCQPSEYALQLILQNETISLENLKRMRPFTTTTKSTNKNTQETVVNQLIREAILRYSERYADNSKQQQQHEKVLDVGCGLGGTLYSLLPLVKQSKDQQHRRSSRRQTKKNNFQYKGISLGATEVQNAQLLANHFLRGIENVNVSFEVGDFDDLNQRSRLFTAGSSSNPYSTIVAVESLSYSDDIQSLLTSLYKSIQKGGLLIVVDDVILPIDPHLVVGDKETHEARVNLFRSALLRPSLFGHAKWMELLSDIGFHVLESRDLTLEYELLEDSVDESLPLVGDGIGDGVFSGVVLNTLTMAYDFYDNAMLRILMRLVRARGDDSGSYIQRLSAWLRLMLLRRGSGASKRLHILRKRAYRDAELSYNMYVCKKI
jgi:SAM-dependent methyltransferase